MSLTAVSINHKTADIAFRERFAFTKSRIAEISKRLISEGHASACIIISTCNRTEFYLKNMADGFFDHLCELTDTDKADISAHTAVYEGRDAVCHLFDVTAGLDSMIIGEDQILGQVRAAHEDAMRIASSDEELNVLFRLAVTAAKRVKTETQLSKTPVSAATLAIKACGEYLGGLSGKNVMVIGASGGIGSIVVKDLLSVDGVRVYVTKRTHAGGAAAFPDGVTVIDYAKRYEYAPDIDAVISATSSPHYVLKTRLIPKNKRRIFADLAVPKDIEPEEDERLCCLDIDDFRRTAARNNEKKAEEAKKARVILKKYEDEFFTRRILSENSDFLDVLYARLEEKFGAGGSKPIRYAVYKVKAKCACDELEGYIECLKKAFADEG